MEGNNESNGCGWLIIVAVAAIIGLIVGQYIASTEGSHTSNYQLGCAILFGAIAWIYAALRNK